MTLLKNKTLADLTKADLKLEDQLSCTVDTTKQVTETCENNNIRDTIRTIILENGLNEGPKGDTGSQGAQGAKGDKGDKGDTGTQGVKGDTGNNGTNGSNGTNGIDGATYSPAVSSIGDISWSNNKLLPNPPTVNIKGPKGDAGIQGVQGLQGTAGQNGSQGVKGDKGDTGLKGDKGDAGIQGIQGIQGGQGLTGLKGDVGEKGNTGLQGVQGIQGVQGLKGDKGDPGKDGLNGINGTDGINGKSPFVNPTTNTWWDYNDITQIFEDTGKSTNAIVLSSVINDDIDKAVTPKGVKDALAAFQPTLQLLYNKIPTVDLMIKSLTFVDKIKLDTMVLYLNGIKLQQSDFSYVGTSNIHEILLNLPNGFLDSDDIFSAEYQLGTV